jgi:hypothetical protein
MSPLLDREGIFAGRFGRVLEMQSNGETMLDGFGWSFAISILMAKRMSGSLWESEFAKEVM